MPNCRNLLLTLTLLMGLIGLGGRSVLASGATGFTNTLTTIHEDDNVAEDPTATDVPPPSTSTEIPATATDIPPTTTQVPPTNTDIPSTATDVPPTATNIPPTATDIPPTATAVPPSATATVAIPTATVPATGGLHLAFADLDVTANPGDTVTRSLTISNGAVAQAIVLEIHSQHDWPLTVTNSLTNTTLASPQHDGIYPLGNFAPDEAALITIALHIPADAAPGADSLTVSVPHRPEIASVQVITTIASPTPVPAVSVEIAGTGASFGAINILGTIDPTIPNLTSTTDSTGAAYIKHGAIRVTVTSTTAWTLRCSLTGSDGLVGDNGLTWRANPDAGWLAFGSESQPIVCATGQPGTTVVVIDLRLRVDLGEPSVPLIGTIQISWDQ